MQGKAVPRFRPIQSFIALTDNHRPDAGGFECVRGFHRTFAQWARDRRPSTTISGEPMPAPCVGDFTPIRPMEDKEVIERFEWVPYSAGSVIAFDFRTPHANAACNCMDMPREVVYGGFLPDVDINRLFAARQRERYHQGFEPDDQWVKPRADGSKKVPDFQFSPLGRKLLGDDPWE